MLISIITPTYNRANLLDRLFRSLLSQSNFAFEWVVIDDGSNDGTELKIREFIKDAPFEIQYYYQENSGKPLAHNFGVRMSKGELVFCLDSDDYLDPNAIKALATCWNENSTNEIIGIVSKRCNPDMVSLNSDFPICKAVTLFDLYYKHHFTGDTMLVYKREIFKKYPFEKFGNEKFIPENSAYLKMDDEGKLLILDENLYICDYQVGGMTKNYRNLLRQNPLGVSYTYGLLSERSVNRILKIKNDIISQAYYDIAVSEEKYEKKSNNLIRILAKLYRIIKI